ncbi:hypothetical protein [Halomonas sp. YLGW01]|nr:hypothetical protein [Halomonas sp. YLGW01]
MIGFEYDWNVWTTYAGIAVLALGQLGIKLLLSDVRGGNLFERIFFFPKR